MAVTPKELSKIEISKYDLDDIERKIDEQIKDNHGLYDWEEAIIDGEYPVEVRNIIARRYRNANWTFVYHQTSKENGERPGLTSFILSQKPVSHCTNAKWHIVD